MHIKKTVTGTTDKPRLCVYKSLKNIFVQLIDDSTSKVILGCSSLTKEIKDSVKYGGNIAAAKVVGKKVAELCIEKGIKSIVFDRNGFKYHGRVKALADSARENGLQF